MHMNIEGLGFAIGIVGAVLLKSSMNISRDYRE
jgi:hypothetical protein